MVGADASVGANQEICLQDFNHTVPVMISPIR